MTPSQISTRGVGVADQFDAWRGWFDTVFDVAPRRPAEAGFDATSRVWALDGLSVSRVAAPPLNAIRTKALIRANPVDHWAITLGTHVPTHVRTRAGAIEAPPNIPFVLSLGGELESERGGDERLQFYLSRDRFRAIAPVLDGATGRVLDTPLGRLLGDYMRLLERRLPELTGDELLRLTQAVSAMVETCVAPTAARVAEAQGQIDLSRMEKVRRAVRSRLRAPALGPAVLCREVGMSRSQLYRLLEGEGGVARYIQRQRLLASHAALSDPADARRVVAIAEELCFADASSFSRAFRQEFGVSPTDVRAAALTGLRTPAVSRERIGAEGRTLRECLQGF